MKIPIHVFNDHTKIFEPKGYAEMETFNAEKIWHLCNWSCWSEEKPKELCSPICVIGHGLCVSNPITKEIWIAKTDGWFHGNSVEVTNYAMTRKSDTDWF